MKTLFNVLKVLALIAAFGMSGAALSACNTVEGIGKDISAAARGVKDAFDGD